MEEYVTLDYDGKAVFIADGEIIEEDAPYGKIWDSDWCEWVKAEADEYEPDWDSMAGGRDWLFDKYGV